MKKLCTRKLLAAFIFAVLAIPLAATTAYAQCEGGTTGGNPGTPGSRSCLGAGVYNSSPPTATSGQQVGLQTDANGNLKVVTSGTPSGTQDVNLTKVGGTAVSLGQKTMSASIPVVLSSDQSAVSTTSTTSYAQGSTTSGQTGSLVQGAVTTSAPTYTNGQTSPLPLGLHGVWTNLITPSGSAVSALAPADGTSNSQNTLINTTFGMNFNGSSWDREFTCSNQASISVTAANTTQIVGLSGTTVIRVCSIAVSMSAAGTVQFITGTGSNCATPTNISAAMTLATGTPLAMTAAPGQSLFRSTAGGEICIAAVTGNVTGWLTYAQY